MQSLTILICAEGFEAALRDEVAAKGAVTVRQGPGWLALDKQSAAHGGHCVFERQRLEEAGWLPAAPLRELARQVAAVWLPVITRGTQNWTLHVFASNPSAAQPLTQPAARLEEAVRAFCAKRFTAVYRRYRRPDDEVNAGSWVLQLCLVPGGLWGAVMPAARLSAARPGGIYRMRFDRNAPSRSYLKLEEVFDRLGQMPQPGQRVIDLGAAPGGWTYSFLKRGCHVLAVDRGPLKLKNMGAPGASLSHQTVNGLTFVPPARWRPADWLVSDMLITPGQAMSVLRTWASHGWARRFVMAIKLPQINPWPALAPIEGLLRRYAGLDFQLRHLYHDRREVTAFGRFTGPDYSGDGLAAGGSRIIRARPCNSGTG